MSSISIVVPVCKVERWLPKCIDSILAQTYSDFDLILVDDGSPDRCGEICDEYAKKDSRIHVIHRQNGGLSAARNTGIEWVLSHSPSEWLTFIDSDDWIAPNFLEVMHAACRHNSCDIAVCDYQRVREGDELPISLDDVSYDAMSPEELWCKYRPITAWGKLYRKDLFEKVRFPAGKIHEDEFTTYKVLFAASMIAYVQLPLYAYFTRESSIVGGGWSEAQILTLDAIDDQVTFFKESGYENAYHATLLHRIEIAYSWLTNAKRCVSFSRANCKQLQKRLRSAISSCPCCKAGMGRWLTHAGVNAWLPMFDYPFWWMTRYVYRVRKGGE